MPYVAARVTLTTAERTTLEQWRRARRTERGLAERAEILLQAADGAGNSVARPTRVAWSSSTIRIV